MKTPQPTDNERRARLKVLNKCKVGDIITYRNILNVTNHILTIEPNEKCFITTTRTKMIVSNDAGNGNNHILGIYILPHTSRHEAKMARRQEEGMKSYGGHRGYRNPPSQNAQHIRHPGGMEYPNFNPNF